MVNTSFQTNASWDGHGPSPGWRWDGHDQSQNLIKICRVVTIYKIKLLIYLQLNTLHGLRKISLQS